MSNHGLIRKDHLILIAVISALVITSSSISTHSYFDITKAVYGQPNPDQMNSNATSMVNTEDIPLEKVHVGDIDVAYKMFGKGDPILLISPAQADMNASELSANLSELSSNHTVIVFDAWSWIFMELEIQQLVTDHFLFNNLQMILLVY